MGSKCFKRYYNKPTSANLTWKKKNNKDTIPNNYKNHEKNKKRKQQKHEQFEAAKRARKEDRAKSEEEKKTDK